jgi:hypothetical protein
MVGFIVYKAARLAGMIREPDVSVPMEMGEKPAATQTALPEEEPPVFCDPRQNSESFQVLHDTVAARGCG